MILRTLVILLCHTSPLPPGSMDLASAIEMYGRGEYQKAVDMLNGSPGVSPDSPEWRLWIAKAYLQLRQWDSAIGELKRAVDLEESDCMLHLWLGRAYGRKASHASILSALELAQKVRTEFELAQSLCPEDHRVRFDLLSYYLEAPGFLGGGRDKARKEADEIARLDPRLGCAARALLARKDKNWDLARNELMQAANDFPNNAEAHADLADLLFQHGVIASAASSAREALRLKGTYPKAQLILAASQIEMRGDVAAAVRSLEALSAGPLFDDDPPFAEVYYVLGKGCTALGRRLEAIRAFESALRFNPEHAGARSALAQVRRLP